MVHEALPAAHRLRDVQIVRVKLVEAIRFKLQGYHVKAVMLGQVRISHFQNTRGIGRLRMAQMGREGMLATGQRSGVDMVDIENAALKLGLSDNCTTPLKT